MVLATQAEELFAANPEACLFKLRKFGERLAKRATAKVGMFVDSRKKPADFVNRLSDHRVHRLGLVSRPTEASKTPTLLQDSFEIVRRRHALCV